MTSRLPDSETDRIRVNGEERPLRARRVDDLLRELGYDADARGIAVALNGEILPRKGWGGSELRDGDELEIVGRYQGVDVDPLLSAPGSNPSWTALDARTVQGTRRVGETDENGTVAVDFGAQTLDEVEVTYRNALSSGQVQWIGFSQFSFSRAPEPSTAALVGLGLVLLSLKRRRA